MRNQVNRQTELRSLLERLNLGAMAQAFADVALKAAKEGLSHEAYLFELATLEEEQRTGRRTARLLRQSGLPLEKTFRTFDVQRLSPALQLHIERLKSGAFLEQATNVIAVGKPGVGKSHVLAAVGYELIVAGYPILWMPSSTLIQRLLAAKRDLRLPQELTKLDKFACVILDDIGFRGTRCQMQDAHIVLVCSAGSLGDQSIIGQAEGGRRKQIIAIAIGRKRSWFTHQGPDNMLIVDAMLLLANQTRQAEGMRGSHIALQRFGSHPNEHVGSNEP